MALSSVPFRLSAAVVLNFSLTARVGNLFGGRRPLASASTANLSKRIWAASVSGRSCPVDILFSKNLITPDLLRSARSSARCCCQADRGSFNALISFSDKREIGRVKSAIFFSISSTSSSVKRNWLSVLAEEALGILVCFLLCIFNGLSV